MVEEMQIIHQKRIAAGVYECVLAGQIAYEVTAPGQFIQLQVPGFMLRRPLSIADVDVARGEITLVYKTFGAGMQHFATLAAGTRVNCFGPLGNGFTLPPLPPLSDVYLVGGGVGIPPLYYLAKQLQQYRLHIILGVQSRQDLFYEAAFAALGETIVVTNDGSAGQQGTVLDALVGRQIDYLYSCGPKAMLRAVEQQVVNIPGQVSLEERMACGMGACMACVCKVAATPGYARICLEGPVFPLGGVQYD